MSRDKTEGEAMTTKTTDRDLLELAAKAACGLLYVPDMDAWIECDEATGARGKWWNPLTDDGDALRLAVRLGLFDGPKFFHFRSLERFAGQDADDYTANRRAIVRAAAEIGKAMP